VTLPEAIVERFGIRPGDEIEFQAAGDAIRIEPAGSRQPLLAQERLRLFDEATRRIRRRRWKGKPPKDRGWTGEGA